MGHDWCPLPLPLTPLFSSSPRALPGFAHALPKRPVDQLKRKFGKAQAGSTNFRSD